MTIVEIATSKAVDYLRDEGIYEGKENILKCANDWWMYGQIVDVETLAALAMTMDYDKSMTREEINYIRQFYFPESYAIENVLF